MGQGHRLSRLEELIQHMMQKPDVKFELMDDVANEFRSNN
jgi:hypothetical protein